MGLEMPDWFTIDSKAVNARQNLAEMFAGTKPVPKDN